MDQTSVGMAKAPRCLSDFQAQGYRLVKTLQYGYGSDTIVSHCSTGLVVLKAYYPLPPTIDNRANKAELNAFLVLPPHPNIVKLLDWYQETPKDGEYTLALELCTGGSLKDFFKHAMLKVHTQIPEPLIWRLLHQMMQAVEHCHKHSIRHRDIHDGNILIHFSGGWPDFKLADFGAAHPRGESRDDLYDLWETLDLVTFSKPWSEEFLDWTGRSKARLRTEGRLCDLPPGAFEMMGALDATEMPLWMKAYFGGLDLVNNPTPRSGPLFPRVIMESEQLLGILKP